MITSWLPGGRTGVFGTFMMVIMGWLLEMGGDAKKWVSDRWRFRSFFSLRFLTHKALTLSFPRWCPM